MFGLSYYCFYVVTFGGIRMFSSLFCFVSFFSVMVICSDPYQFFIYFYLYLPYQTYLAIVSHARFSYVSTIYNCMLLCTFLLGFSVLPLYVFGFDYLRFPSHRSTLFSLFRQPYYKYPWLSLELLVVIIFLFPL